MTKMILPVRDQASVSQSINVGSIQELLFGSSLVLDEDFKPCVDAGNNILHVYLKSTSASGRCPCCGETSSAVNSISFRHPQWMPVNGMTTYAHMSGRPREPKYARNKNILVIGDKDIIGLSQMTFRERRKVAAA